MKRFMSGILVAMMVLSLCSSAWASEKQPDEPQTEKNRVTFSDVSQLTTGESVQRTLTGADGAEIVVGIKKVPTYARTDSETWQVWYKSISGSIEFYMTVSNNKVTSVYDYSISLVGASYDDAKLTKTSTYGKLTFTYKAPAGLAAYTCWLKGTVTGEDNQIEVTWQM